MENQVIFRDYQEQTAADHNNIQAYVRQGVDHIVLDAVTASRRYAGLTVTKSAQAEATVAPGRFYDALGAIYARSSSLVQSVTTYLPAAAKRYVTVSVFGTEVETDVQERDFLVNVATGATEPDAVAMQRARAAQIAFTAGAESGDPQPAPIPATHAIVAHILLDPTQIVSITMVTENAVSSTEGLDTRAKILEAFKTATEPRIASIASDIAALSNEVARRGQGRDISQLYEDMARVKAILEIPSTASDYGADRYLDVDKSDETNSASLGYDALVQEGIRFPDANVGLAETDIFSANDPNAMKSGGFLLPAYDSILKMSIGPYNTDLGISQYGFQTFNLVQKQMARQRIRYGSFYTYCTNSAWWRQGTYDSASKTFTRNGETFSVVEGDATKAHVFVRLQQFWVDTYQEPYWEYSTSSYTITGAQVAQTFLVGNDFWLTRIGVYFTVKAANENVFLTVCEVTNGVPNLSKVVLQQTLAHADMLVGQFTRVTVQPTFLRAGTRYALVLTSNANHKIGLAFGQNYLDGTFFYSTDGNYFQGDLTKDMMLELWGAKFRASSVTIEMLALNLDGGIRAIDILARMVVPASTQLIPEIQPGGSGAWIALTQEDLTALNSTPPLARFRFRFVGTRDIMPGLFTTGSQVTIRRPKLAFKHISDLFTLAGATTSIVIKTIVEGFDDTPHDFGARVRVGGSWVNPATTTTTLLDAATKRYERRFAFTVSSTTSFRLELTGATNSAGNTFHVAEMVYWSL